MSGIILVEVSGNHHDELPENEPTKRAFPSVLK